LPGADLKLLHREIALRLVETKRAQPARLADCKNPGSDQAVHAEHFTAGVLSFAHEMYGQMALALGVEPRSPLSDRRMIEFAIQMPLEAKLFTSWYKHLLRKSMAGVLPEEVRWRRDVGQHPGWKFYERFASKAVQSTPEIWSSLHFRNTMDRWIDGQGLEAYKDGYMLRAEYTAGYKLLSFSILENWLIARQLMD
jgi:asparagine synthetase B (glutamine-hydrolysing)